MHLCGKLKAATQSGVSHTCIGAQAGQFSKTIPLLMMWTGTQPRLHSVPTLYGDVRQPISVPAPENWVTMPSML